MWRVQMLLCCLMTAVAASGCTAVQATSSGSSSSGDTTTGGAGPAGAGAGVGSYPGSSAAGSGWSAVGNRQVAVQDLLELREAVENWSEFSAANDFVGWDAPTPPCSWSGITCSDDGTILTLSWQCRGCVVRAVGTLPPQLGSMRTLVTLDLQSNRFYGTLPRQWGEVDTWSALQNLYLNGNNLTGSLPGEWGDAGAMPSLLQLRADSNRLTGTLPQRWGSQETSMRELGVIRLSNNSLNGSLPEQWGTPGAFPKLSVLALDANRLTGPLPELWGARSAMTFLQELYVQGNQLTGGLPGSWGISDGMPRMRFFFAANNRLGGTLPTEWGQSASFPVLKTLDFNNTGLYGTMPPQWGNTGAMPALDAMRVENNDLSGSIPSEWRGLTALSRLVVQPGNPRLCGPPPPGLPFSLCDDRDLTCLQMPVELNSTCGLIIAPLPAGAPGAVVGGAVVAPAPTQEAAMQAAEAAMPLDGGSRSRSGSSGGSSVGVIVGGVVGGMAGAAVAAALLLLTLWRRRRRRRQEQLQQEETLQGGSFKPSARPFITEEEEMEQGGGGGSPNGSHLAPMPLPFAASPTAAVCSASPSSGAAAIPAPPSSSNILPGVERRPSRLASLLTSSGLLSVGSGSMLYCWCNDSRTASLELPPTPGVETELATAGGGMQVMSQIVEEGEGRISGEKTASPEAVEQAPASPGSSPLGSISPGASGGGAFGRTLSTALPWSDWEILPEEVEIAKRPDGSDWLLGSGGFGRVYKGLRHGVQPVAVKVIPMHGDLQHPGALAEARQEIAILRACRDVNIVQFVGAYLGPEQTMLVTEYMEGGDLMHNIAAGRVNWYRRGRKIALDVARGLVFLHSRRVVHFDLKSPNILLARDGTAKIGDVGMAKIMNRDYITGVVSTLAWSAPEMLWGAKCTEKADIYSFGIVLWEICAGEVPERGRLRDLRMPDECPAEARQLILLCLEASPSQRPSALQLVERLAGIPATPPPSLPLQPRVSAGAQVGSQQAAGASEQAAPAAEQAEEQLQQGLGQAEQEQAAADAAAAEAAG